MIAPLLKRNCGHVAQRSREVLGEGRSRGTSPAFADTPGRACRGRARGSGCGGDGVERTHHPEGERPLKALVGRVTVARDGYGAWGEKTLFPLDAELNLPGEVWSFGVRQRGCEEAAKGSYEDALEALRKHSGAKTAKGLLEEIVQRAAQCFGSSYLARRMAWQSESPEPSEVLVLTFDGEGVVVRHEDQRPGTKAAASRSTSDSRSG